MAMINLSTALLHYKRGEIQEAILENAISREVGVKYSDRGFGKRPDVLIYPKDILELAKKGATSFHVSEERWSNPLTLKTDMKQEEQDKLRTGWDLIIDVDFEIWQGTKIIADSIIKALRSHGISSVSCKFSGNKGFHIAVPFEAFPEKVHGKETRTLFPEATRRILSYVNYYIDSPENKFEVSKKIMNLQEFSELREKLSYDACEGCGAKVYIKTERYEFICKNCGEKRSAEEKFLICEKCKLAMERIHIPEKDACKECGGKKFIKKVNLAIDSTLISSRHLYRSVYSLHEKSGLVSVPVDSEKIMEFRKELANPHGLKISEIKFPGSAASGEASTLLLQAFDFQPRIGVEKRDIAKGFEHFETAAPVKFFPPCILKILEGLEDGKKRALFILTNFLSSVGWHHEEIEKLLYEWNKKNRPQLRDVFIKGHLSYHRRRKKMVLPPNCDNELYYRALNICCPDEICSRVKNPVQYVRLRMRYVEKATRGSAGKAKRLPTKDRSKQ